MKLDSNRTTAIKTRVVVLWFRECKRIARELDAGATGGAKKRLTALMGSIIYELQDDDIRIEIE